jgi:chromate transporter
LTALDTATREPPPAWDVFTAFLKIGVLGFGGVAAFARHVLVVERGFLDDRDFAESFGVASTLPGANTVNMATMLGDRWGGVVGVLAALGGLLAAPLLILIGAASLYARFSYLADVRAALAGAAAAAAGLVLGTALKLLRGLGSDLVTVLVAALVCLASAALRAPMPLILGIAVPISLGIGFARQPPRE